MKFIVQILSVIFGIALLFVVSAVIILIGLEVYGAWDYPGLILYCLVLHLMALSTRGVERHRETATKSVIGG